MLRRTSFAELDVTNAARLGRIPGLAVTSERCRPVRATSISRGRSCGVSALRLRSPTDTAWGRSRSKKRWSRCIWPAFQCGEWRTLRRPSGASPSTVSNLNKKIYAKIEAWRNRRIEGEHPYLYLDGIVMKRTWAGEVRNVSLLVASAVNSEGF